MNHATLKEQVAEKIFPFQLYLSGKFNHDDIIKAMCDMAELFESFFAESVINGNGVKMLNHAEGDPSANEQIK